MMNPFRILISLFLVVLIGYTFVVGTNHGWNLVPVFFGDIMAMNWPGQFNLDFMTFLTLSAVWVAWRNHFSATGLGLGLVALFGGMLFLSIYLLYHSNKNNGDMKALLLGPVRAKQ